MSILTAALGAAARGYPVAFMRLTDDGKFPAIRSAHRAGDPQRGKCRGECGRLGHGIYDATTNEDRLVEMHNASRFPNGYAIACGRDPHRVLGIDLDVKNGHDGVTMLARIAETIGFEIPPTIEVETPSGGRHVWLSLPEDAKVRNYVGKLGDLDAPGIDIRSTGGQLVGPGSRGPKGVYRLACAPDTPLAPIPALLLKLLTPAPKARPDYGPSRAGARSSRRVDAALALAIGAKVGTRNDSLFRASCAMAQIIADGELSEAEARDRLLRAAAQTELDYAEAEQTITNGFSYGGRQP